MDTICLNVWVDWALLKNYVSPKARKVMELIEDEKKEDEAMKLLGQLPGPLDIHRVDSTICHKLLHKFIDNTKERCRDCCYLVGDDNGNWICDDCGKNIYDICDEDCSANQKW